MPSVYRSRIKNNNSGTLPNFSQINYQLGVLNGNAHDIQVGLLDVQTQLNQLEQYTLAYSQAISKEMLITEMNGCLNYAAVHNGADIGQTLEFIPIKL